ncbi:MAG: hypothetical protein KJ015_41145, partial [Myxococcales bacterium]|nr:hypothetical protein [Myxococcales bacterium]
MKQPSVLPITFATRPAVPVALLALHDEALGAFLAHEYRRALPLLGRLALALPVGHGLRPTVRASRARAYLELGDLDAARRELALARAAEPENPMFRVLDIMLRRAERAR